MLSGGLTWALAGGGAAAAGAVAARAMFSPRSCLLGRVVFRGSPADPPRVALTFDDGPGDATGPALDVLGAHGVRAAFFVIGLNAQRRPDLVARMYQEGHLVGNHSFHHARLGTLRRRRYWRRELAETDAAVESIMGRRPRLFRPPMGFRNLHVAAEARRGGYVTTTWTVRALDGRATSPAPITARLLLRAAPGAILALHDGCEPRRPRSRRATVAALPMLIEKLRGRGLEPVRLDELIGCPPYADDAPGS